MPEKVEDSFYSDKYKWQIAVPFIFNALKDHPEGLATSDLYSEKSEITDEMGRTLTKQFKAKLKETTLKPTKLNQKLVLFSLYALLEMGVIKKEGEGNATRYFLKAYRELSERDRRTKAKLAINLFQAIEEDVPMMNEEYPVSFEDIWGSFSLLFAIFLTPYNETSYYHVDNELDDRREYAVGHTAVLLAFEYVKFYSLFDSSDEFFLNCLFQHLEYIDPDINFEKTEAKTLQFFGFFVEFFDLLKTIQKDIIEPIFSQVRKETFDIIYKLGTRKYGMQNLSYSYLYSFLCPGLLSLSNAVGENLSFCDIPLKKFIPKNFEKSSFSPTAQDFINYPVIAFSVERFNFIQNEIKEWETLTKKITLQTLYKVVFKILEKYREELLRIFTETEKFIQELDELSVVYKRAKFLAVKCREPLPGFCDLCKTLIKGDG